MTEQQDGVPLAGGRMTSGIVFPEQRKEPLTSASHVRTALARFDQVQDVTDADRALAFENIRRLAVATGAGACAWRRPH